MLKNVLPEKMQKKKHAWNIMVREINMILMTTMRVHGETQKRNKYKCYENRQKN